MAFTAITTAQVAVDAPYTAELGQTIKDDLDDLNGRITAPTDVVNGGAELDSDADGIPDGTSVELYTGGSQTLDTTTPYDGVQAVKFTHPGGAGNGGGYWEFPYSTISEYVSPLVQFALYVSDADIHVLCTVRYFTAGKVYISDENIYDSVANPTTWTIKTLFGIPPATARYMKIRLIGGETDVDVAGDVYFDAVHYDPFPKTLYDNFTIANGSYAGASTSYENLNSASIRIPKGFSLMLLPITLITVPSTENGARYRISSTYSTAYINLSPLSTGQVELNISALSGSQTLVTQGYRSPAAGTITVAKVDTIATYIRR